MGVTENPTALQILFSAKFHRTDAEVIGCLYAWHDAIPQMMESPEELKKRIKETNGIQEG